MFRGPVIQLMRFLGVSRISRYVHRSQPTILMYHRIVDDPLLPGIKVKVFEKQLSYLKKNFNVIPMEELVNDISMDKVKPYSVALTFDDGHYDFYDNAWPLLKKYNLPASIYVTTGFIDKECWLWPDLLKYQLITTELSEIEDPELGTLSLDRHDVLETWSVLGDYCLKLSHSSRADFINNLGKKLHVRCPIQPQKPFSPLSWKQLQEMNGEGLDVGSHSVSHPILSSLSKEDLDFEISKSYKRIEKEIGRPPTGICYPNGMSGDVSVEVENAVSKIYRYGLVAYPYTLEKKNLMHLGRRGASENIYRFVQVVNGLSRRDNYSGEYK